MNLINSVDRAIKVHIFMFILCMIELIIGIMGLYHFLEVKDVNFKDCVASYYVVTYGTSADIVSGTLCLCLVIAWFVWYKRNKNWLEEHMITRDDTIYVFFLGHCFKIIILILVLSSYQTILSEHDVIMNIAPKLWDYIVIYVISSWTCAGIFSLCIIWPMISKIYDHCID